MKHFFFIPLLAVTLLSYGQAKKMDLKLGEEYSLPKKSREAFIWANEKTGYKYFSMPEDAKKLHVAMFDAKTLALTSETSIDLPAPSRHFTSRILVNHGTNYYWVNSDWDPKPGKEYLYYDKLDEASAKITVSKKLMIETGKMGGHLGSGLRPLGKYEFNFDADKKLFLVTYRLAPEERDNRKSYAKAGFHVFNEEMNKVWGEEFTMPYTEAIMEKIDLSLDRDGNAYMLAKIYTDDDRKDINESSKPGYRYEVLKFSTGQKLTKSVIPLEEHFVKEASMNEDPVHGIVITLTYSKSVETTEAEGVFIAMVGENGDIVKYKNGFFPFSHPLPVKNEDSKHGVLGKKVIPKKLAIRNIVFEKDGSFLLACEVHDDGKILNQIIGGTKPSTTQDILFFNNIVAVKINDAGKCDWIKTIYKKQEGDYIGSLSYKLFTDPSGYYFLYMDHRKNFTQDKEDKLDTYINGYDAQLVLAKLDKNGRSLPKELVFDNPEKEVIMAPVYFYRLNSNQFYSYASILRGGIKMLLLTLK